MTYEQFLEQMKDKGISESDIRRQIILSVVSYLKDMTDAELYEYVSENEAAGDDYVANWYEGIGPNEQAIREQMTYMIDNCKAEQG